ncbi:MAG TPA: bifunctional homocysteine S-methyltransferase/methylenetetrahydrofolate reductase [Candidatus Dormibacteraeota bacterium]|nr:bifunctional homocysteine S-methyltransferase/methylenetetrahydrofolate reductase [Candidatus Dormibacteraeota bacterium]
MTDLWTALRERVLVVDGAMGTMLHAAGISLDRSLPELNLSNPGLVRAVHSGYLDAGADVIQTNTFGASRLRLAAHGHGDLVRKINAAGVRIALEARTEAGRPVLVAGSISPAVSVGQRGHVDPEERAAAVREQVEALAAAGVDLLVFETFGHLAELVEAVGIAAAACDLPLVAQATFADDGQTLGGESPRQVAGALERLPVAVIGSNCTLGPQGLLGMLRELGRHTSLPLIAQPNAGMPRMIGGRRFQYTSDTEYFARHVRRYVEAGAVMVGGCCGTTPDHVRAAAAAVAGLAPARSSARRPPAAGQPEPAAAGAGQWGLDERLAAGRFVVAVEVTPPLGGRPEHAGEHVAILSERGVDLFAIAPRPSARAQMSPMSLALHLRQHARVEPILTVTTWDRSIMALQADLLGAHALGIRSVICRTGSPPLRGDYPNVDGIWEVDSVGLIGLLSGLNRGQDCNGLALDAQTSFCVGARFNPNAGDAQRELARTRAKVEAGARFLVTWPLHELDGLRRMLAELGDRRVPVLLAVSPLRSFGEAEYLRHEVPDVAVPDAVLEAMRQAPEGEREAGLRLAEQLLTEARPLVDGVLLGVPEGPDAVTVLDRLRRAATQPSVSASRPRA